MQSRGIDFVGMRHAIKSFGAVKQQKKEFCVEKSNQQINQTLVLRELERGKTRHSLTTPATIIRYLRYWPALKWKIAAQKSREAQRPNLWIFKESLSEIQESYLKKPIIHQGRDKEETLTLKKANRCSTEQSESMKVKKLKLLVRKWGFLSCNTRKWIVVVFHKIRRNVHRFCASVILDSAPLSQKNLALYSQAINEMKEGI